MPVVVGSSHVVFAAPPSSLSSPAPVWGPSHRRKSSSNFTNMDPSHGLQLFINCSSVGPFHRVQCFRSRLLQRGSHTGSQVLPANLLQHEILFTGSQFLWGACSSVGFPQGQGHSLFWVIYLLWRGFLHRLQLEICSPKATMGCRGTECLITVFSVGCRGVSAPATGAPLPCPSSLTLASAELFS